MENLKTQAESDFDKCNKEFDSDPIHVGRFATESEAKEILEAYFSHSNTNGNSKHVYGHIFGLETLKELMKKIQAHNDNNAVKVHGVRMYFGRSKRPHLSDITDDLILMPVKEDASDLYTINRYEKIPGEKPGSSELTGDEIILVESRPCPNQCTKKKD